MPGRGSEDIFINNENFYNPSSSSIKFSRTPSLLAVIFRGSSLFKCDDKFLSNISHFLITSDAKRTEKNVVPRDS